MPSVLDNLKKLLPSDLRSCVSLFRDRTYLGDGIMTSHVTDFSSDKNFCRAYGRGWKTGSWNGADPRWRVYTACWAAKHARSLAGDFVECGVNRGGMSLAVMDYIDFNSLDKDFLLLDTFSGIPLHLKAMAAEFHRDSYARCYEEAVQTFREYPRARIIAGAIPETLNTLAVEKVCYLSIDMNCAEPEIAAFQFFWPKLVPGAIVLLDDYAYSEAYRRQKMAFDSLAEQMRFEILSLPTGQGLIVKG